MRLIRTVAILAFVPVAVARAATPTEDWKGLMSLGAPMQIQGERVNDGVAITGQFIAFSGDSIVIRDAALNEDRWIPLNAIDHIYVPGKERHGLLNKVFGGGAVGAVIGLAFTATGPGAAIGGAVGLARWLDGKDWTEVPFQPMGR